MADLLFAGDLPDSIVSRVDATELGIMVAGANGKALRVAPCLAMASDALRAEAVLVLFGALKRWSEAGAGAVQTRQAGPFSETLDTRQRTGYNLWPSEIETLQELCASGAEGKAFSTDTIPATATVGESVSELGWTTLSVVL